MDNQDVFGYIKGQENNYRTVRVPLTNSKDWNMYEHIERCYNVANGWFHKGANDGIRPYDDIVTPIINVAFRSEGFDVKDIVPYVNSISERHKSFLVKKFHPKWARKHQLDQLIDDAVESSIIYDLVIFKKTSDDVPEVIDLQSIAFCDQTNALAGSLCIKHNYSITELDEVSKNWDKEAVRLAIAQSVENKDASMANDQEQKTPSNYIEVYELHGKLPATWKDPTAEPYTYTDQLYIVGYYTDSKGGKQGIIFYSGESKAVTETFDQLKIDRIRSKGRACGKSIVELLFEPQVWKNYAGIKLKKMLDSAYSIILTDSDEIANKKLTEVKENTILKQNKGDNTYRLDGTLQNIPAVQNYQVQQDNSARLLGSASDAQLGTNPVSGTPFSLQQLVVQQGQGIHEYRQGKIASFFADIIYPKYILPSIIRDMNKGITFSDELSFDEMNEIATIISENMAEKIVNDMIFEKGEVPTEQDRTQLIQTIKEQFVKGGNRKFFEIIKDELKDIPIDVYVNIKGKQKYMAQNADKLSNIITNILANIDKIRSAPGIAKAYNQLLEESGMSGIDFSETLTIDTTPPPVEQLPAIA